MQVEEDRLADVGHHGDAHVPADALFLQHPHDAARGVQAEGAAAGEHYRVDHLPVAQRIQGVGVPGAVRAAPDVHAAGSPLRGQYDRAAGHGGLVLSLSHQEIGQFGDLDLFHISLPAPPALFPR